MLGNDVVLEYVTPVKISFNDLTPSLKRLFGYQRVRLDANQSTQVCFSLNIQSLLTVTHDDQNG